LVVLLAALLTTLSQSSLAALLLGLAVLAALRWRALVVGGAVVAALAVGVAVVIAAPEQVGLHTKTSKGLDRSTRWCSSTSPSRCSSCSCAPSSGTAACSARASACSSG
ncbi:MAG: hypothetical protein ACJ76Q_01485, partial [Solirubrobacteraceae bacterium]